MRYVARVLQSKIDTVERKIFETDDDGNLKRYLFGENVPSGKRIVASAVVQCDDNKSGVHETIEALKALIQDLQAQEGKLAS